MRLLVVEDEYRMAGLPRRGLEEEERCQITVVRLGPDGLDSARSGEFGLHLGRRVRTEGNRTTGSTIVITLPGAKP